ncbi:MAG: helicase HerA domain-containing protein, partial [Blastocatellia bacterium]
MRGIRIVQKLFNKRLKRETASTLAHLASEADRKQAQLSNEIGRLSGTNEPAIRFGTTTQGQEIMLPMETAATHGLVLGASGAGKSFVALSLISQMLRQGPGTASVSFGILDAKGELFERVL